MHTLVVLAHPYAKSYCYALYERVVQQLAQSGHTVDRLHLDQEDFDPVMRSADLAVYARRESADPAVPAYQARIDAAQQLVFIFPIWWEVMPALLKGYIDKVFTNGWAYEPSRFGVKGHLGHIQRAVVITTMNTPKWAYRWLYGDAVQRSLVRGTLRKCGVKNVKWVALSPVSHVSDARRQTWLDRVGALFAA
ncbi:MAG: NAD(P)H dehydrogenase [Burkholderiales bacterium PBB5]|nr:MAG: NAD(P)H dehydrogenase [Burkholderiales bacterium PBB5]